MNNRTRYVPALIMLTAGFITCISTIIHDYTTEEILLITTGVMTVFLIVGLIVRFIIDTYIVVKDEPEEEENKEDSEEKEDKEDKEDSQESEKKDKSEKE